MNNVRTRGQRQARLGTTEALTSAERDGKSEIELQAQLPTVVPEERKSPLKTRKRRLGAALGEEQECAPVGTAAIPSGVQDGIRGKLRSEPGLTTNTRRAAMGSSNPRLTTHHRGSRRGTSGTLERVKDCEVDRPSEKNIDHASPGRELDVVFEQKKGKRKVLGNRVRKSDKEKDGDAARSRSRAVVFDNPISQYLSYTKKRKDVLDITVIEDVDLTGRFTRAALTKVTAKAVTDSATGADDRKKLEEVKSMRKADAAIAAQGKAALPIRDEGAAEATAPRVPEGATAKTPHVDVRANDSKLVSSNKAANVGPGLRTKSTAPPEKPAVVPVFLDALREDGPKLSKVVKTRNEEASRSRVHVVKERRGKLSKSKSARITRGMRKRGLNPKSSPEASPMSGEDLHRGSSIVEPSNEAAAPMAIDQTTAPIATDQTGASISADQSAAPISADQTAAPISADQTGAPISADQTGAPMTVVEVAVPNTAAESPRMQLRNQKKLSSAVNSNAAERPLKRFKKKQDKPRADSVQNDVEKSKTIDAELENRTASGIAGLGAIDASTSERQVAPAEADRNGNSLLDREEHTGPDTEPLLTEGVHTRSSKIDVTSGNEPGLRCLVSGRAVKPVRGRVKKGSDEKDSSHTNDHTEGSRRNGDGIGRLKRRGKKKADPGGLLNSEGHFEKGGVDSMQNKKAAELAGNELQDAGTHLNQRVEGSGNFGPGPSIETRTESGKQNTVVPRVEAVAAEASGKGQKVPVEGTKDKAVVEKSVQVAENDRGCEQSDPQDGPKQLSLRTRRETSSQIVGVLTRGRKYGKGRGSGPAKGSLRTKVWRRAYLGRSTKGEKTVGSGSLLDNSKSRVNDGDVDSAQNDASCSGSDGLQGKQTHPSTTCEEPAHLEAGLTSEVQTGLGKATVHEQGMGVERESGSLEQPSNNIVSEEKIGAEKPMKFGESQQIYHEPVVSKLPEDEDDRLKHSQAPTTNSLPGRAVGYHTRGRKADAQAGTESETEHELQPVASEPSHQLRKKESGAGKGNDGSSSEHAEKGKPRGFSGRPMKRGRRLVGMKGLSKISEHPDESGAVGAVSENPKGSGFLIESIEKERPRSYLGRPKKGGRKVLGIRGLSRTSVSPENRGVDSVSENLKDDGPSDEHVEEGHQRRYLGRPKKGGRKVVGIRGLSKTSEDPLEKDGSEAVPESLALETGPSGLQDEIPSERILAEAVPVEVPEPSKFLMELRGQRIEAESSEAAAIMEKRSELQGEGSGAEKVTEIPSELAAKEGAGQEKDLHDNALETRPAGEGKSQEIVNAQVSKENPGKKAGMKDFLRSRGDVGLVMDASLLVPKKGHLRALREVMPVKDTGLRLSTRSATVELEKVVVHPGKSVEMPSKKKRKKHGIGTQDPLKAANDVTPVSADVATKGPELADNPLANVLPADRKGRRGKTPIVETVSPAELRPPLEIADVRPEEPADNPTADRKGRKSRTTVVETVSAADLQSSPNNLDVAIEEPADNPSADRNGRKRRTTAVKSAGDLRPSLDIGIAIEERADNPSAERNPSVGGKVLRGRTTTVETVSAAELRPAIEEQADNPSVPADRKTRRGKATIVRSVSATDVRSSLENTDVGLAIDDTADIPPVPADRKGRKGKATIVKSVSAADLRSSLEDTDVGLAIEDRSDNPSSNRKGRRIRPNIVESMSAADLQPSLEAADVGLTTGDKSDNPLADGKGGTPSTRRKGRRGKATVVETVSAADLRPSLENIDVGLVIEERIDNHSAIRKRRKGRTTAVKTVSPTDLRTPLVNSATGLAITDEGTPSLEPPCKASNSGKGRKGKKRKVQATVATDLQPAAQNIALGLRVEAVDLSDEPDQGKKANGDQKSPKELSAELPPPKRRRGGRARKVTSASMDAENSNVIPEVCHTTQLVGPHLSSSVGKEVDAGRAGLPGDADELARNATQVGVPINAGDLDRASDNENQQILVEVVSVDGSTLKEIPDKAVVKGPSLEYGVTADTVQSEPVVEGPAEPLSGAVEVARDVTQVGSDNTLQFAEAQGGIAPVQVSSDADELSRNVSLVSIPIEVGNLYRASNDEDHQVLVQVLDAGGSTSKEMPEKIDVKSSSLEDGVTADAVRSELVEGQAEPVSSAVEVAQNVSQVGADIPLQSVVLVQNVSQVGPDVTSQSPGAHGGTASGRAPLEKKKRARKIYKFGSDFRRVTRGKPVASIEATGDKIDPVAEAEAVTGGQVEISVSEEIVPTAEKVVASACLKETDAEEERELKEKSPNVPDSTTASLNVAPRNALKTSLEEVVECSQVSHLGKEDVAVMTIEQEKHVEVTVIQDALVLESPGKDAGAVLEGENVEVLSSHMEETNMPVRLDQPGVSMVRLLIEQQKNHVLSKHPASPDGPFALEDGRSLKSHRAQEAALSTVDGGLSPEMSHSLCLEKICVRALNYSVNLNRARSISSTPDESESPSVVETSDPITSVSTSDPTASSTLDAVTARVESDPFFCGVESEPDALTAESERKTPTGESMMDAPIVASEPGAPLFESESAVSNAESEPAAPTVESELHAPTGDSEAEAAAIESEPEVLKVESELHAPKCASDLEPRRVESELEAPTRESEAKVPMVEAEQEALQVEAEQEALQVEAEQEALQVEAEQEALQVESELVAPRAEPMSQAPIVVSGLEAPLAESGLEAPLADSELEGPLVESEPEAPLVESEPEAPLVESEPEAPVVVKEPQVPVVESDVETPVVESEPEARLVESDVETPVVESEPEARLVESEPEAPLAESEPEAPLAESEPEASLVEPDSEVLTVESEPTASILEAGPVTSVVEANATACVLESTPAVLESDRVASTVEADPVAALESDHVALTVEADPAAHTVEGPPVAAAGEADFITIAECLQPTITPDDSTADIPNPVVAEKGVVESVTGVGNSDSVATVTISDSVFTPDETIAFDIVKNSSVPLPVINTGNTSEALEIDPVSPIEDERVNGESLVAETIIAQEEVEEGEEEEASAVKVLIKDCGSKDDKSTESPLLRLTPAAEQVVEQITGNGNMSCVTLEFQGKQEVITWQDTVITEANVGTLHGSDDQTTSKETGHPAAPSLEALCRQLLIATEDGAVALARFSGFQVSPEPDSWEQNLQGESADCVEQRQPALVEDSDRQLVSDAEDEGERLETDSSMQVTESGELVSPPVGLIDEERTVDSQDVLRGQEQSEAAETPQEGSSGAWEDHLEVSSRGTEEGLATWSPKSTAVAVSRTDPPSGSMENVGIVKDPHDERMSSGLQKSRQDKCRDPVEAVLKAYAVVDEEDSYEGRLSPGLEKSHQAEIADPDERVLRAYADFESSIEEAADALDIEDDTCHSEATDFTGAEQALSEAEETLANAEILDTEAQKESVDVEKVSQLVETAQDAQAEVEPAEAEAESVNVDTEGQKADSQGEELVPVGEKEVHRHLEVSTEVHQSDSEQDKDAEVNVADSEEEDTEVKDPNEDHDSDSEQEKGAEAKEPTEDHEADSEQENGAERKDPTEGNESDSEQEKEAEDSSEGHEVDSEREKDAVGKDSTEEHEADPEHGVVGGGEDPKADEVTDAIVHDEETVSRPEDLETTSSQQLASNDLLPNSKNCVSVGAFAPLLPEEETIRPLASVPPPDSIAEAVDELTCTDSLPLDTEAQLSRPHSPPLESEERLTPPHPPPLESEEQLTRPNSPLLGTEDQLAHTDSPAVDTEEQLTRRDAPQLTSEEQLTRRDAPPLATEEQLDSLPVDTEEHLELAEGLEDTAPSSELGFPVEVGPSSDGDLLQPEEVSNMQMELREKEDPKNPSEDTVAQRSTGKAPGTSKKRKGRLAGEAPPTKDVVAHEGADREDDTPARVLSQKKGFLLASTSIESGGMRIRPRPLDPDQSMPIFVEGRDKDFYEYDGGSFYRWVQQQDEAARAKKSVADPAADGVGEGGRQTAVSKSYLHKRRPIFIPLFRKLPEDPETSQIAEQGAFIPFARPQGYLRNAKSVARTLGPALGCSYSTVPPMYDMDDEDEEWLEGFNVNVEESDQALSDDAFEALMELFEREFYRISQGNNNSSQLPRNAADKSGPSGPSAPSGGRGKRMEAESSQRPPRIEAVSEGAMVLCQTLEALEGAVSPTEVQRRFTVQNGLKDCCICNGGENSDFNPVRRCEICSINVHQSCYGIRGTEENGFAPLSESPRWCCRKCEAVVGGRALSSISCAICCKSGGAMKPTTEPSKWAHVACALYTNETFFVDTEAMEPVEGLAAAESRAGKQRERCGLCGAREGSCVRCSTRGCRAPFHISCGVSQGASFELRHSKQLVVAVRSFCPRHASQLPGVGDPVELLPAVSTESSDALEMRHVEHRDMGEKGNAAEDASMNGAEWQGSLRNSEGKISRKRKRGVRARVTDASRRPQDLTVKDVPGVSRTLPRSLSVLKKNTQAVVSQYMDETDPYLLGAAEERLESEAVSAATTSSSHLASENENHAGQNVTISGEEVDHANQPGKDKSVAGDGQGEGDREGDALAVSDIVVSPTLPSLDNLSTSIAPPESVKAVYTFWQEKRLKASRPLLHELRQHQEARSLGIFNKVVHRSSELLPAVGSGVPAGIAVTRRPRSLGTRDPVASRFSELRQQLDKLRSIAGNVVRREQLKLEDQKLLYESAQQRLLVAKQGPKGRRHCFWCENTQNLLSCTSCPKGFCFQCFKHKRGYGVKGWIAASRQEKYVCNFCLGSATREKAGAADLAPLAFPEPRSTPVSRVALVPGRPGAWNRGLEVRTKPNSGKQVSFLNQMISKKGDPPTNPYGSSSSTPRAAAPVAPGRGKVMNGERQLVSAAQAAYTTECSVPNTTTTERRGAVNRADHEGVVSASGPNDPEGEEESRGQQAEDGEADKEGKRVKRRRAASVLTKQTDTVLRATKRIKKLARSSSFVYGSEDETVSESEEPQTDKKTVKLSDLRDKEAKRRRKQKHSSSEAEAETEAEAEAEDPKQGNKNNNAEENGHPPLKFGIKFSSGKLILRRCGPTQHP